MAEVTGIFGNQPVELNNAATEATLRLLLQATLANNRQTVSSVSQMAQRAGLDPERVAAANTGLSGLNRSASISGAVLGGLNQATASLQRGFNQVVSITSTLASGSGQASDVFKMLGQIPGPIGLVANGAALLAQFQEKQLQSYRDLTKIGVNLGGSLTDLRLAAANTYMTMDQFANFMKSNSESIVQLGSTADQGARAFIRTAKEFNESPTGKNLRALGFTSEEMNSSLVKFMALQGKAGTEDVKITQQVQEATAGYLTQLDALTKVTGISKEKLAQEQKKAEMNAAFQAKLASLAPAEQAKVKAAYDRAAASGIKGATDLVIARTLNLEAQTKEASLLTGVFPEMAMGLARMTDVALDTASTSADVNRAFGDFVISGKNTTDGQEQFAGALLASGSEIGVIFNQVLGLANQATRQGFQSSQDIGNAFEKAAEEGKKQQTSQASAAAETEQSMKRLALQIQEQLMPAVANLLPHLNNAASGMAKLAGYLLETPKALAALGIAVGGLTAIMIASKIKLAVDSARGATSGGGGTPGGGGGRKFGGRLLGGAGGLLGGFALDKLSEMAEESGNTKTAGALDIGSAALTGAGMGAIFGPAGAAIGGIAGGAYGLYKNYDKLFSNKIQSQPVNLGELGINTDRNSTIGTTLPEVSALSTQILGSSETFSKEVERLNTQIVAMNRYLKETAENTKRTIDAVKSLTGNLYPSI